MNRITEAWFEFKGVRSDTLDIYITQMPRRTIPDRQVEIHKVAGRSGGVRISDGSYNDVEITIGFKMLDLDNIDAVMALMTGTGTLRLSDDPGHVYHGATITTPIVRDYAEKRFDAQTFVVVFNCHPFRYQYPEVTDIPVPTSGTVVTNPGTMFSEPRIRIEGSGTFEVTVGTGAGATIMQFHDVESPGIIVDTELGDALTGDGVLLANDCIDDSELFTIAPGEQEISWQEGGEDEEGNPVSGSITRIVIEKPRWRDV